MAWCSNLIWFGLTIQRNTSECDTEAKVGSLSGALTTVSAISGPTIFCSVLKNFQAVSWAGCRHRSIKVTTPGKQICIKNKVNLSSVNWKFKRRSGTSFNLSQWIKFKICLLQLNYSWNKSKQFKNCFIYCPKIYSLVPISQKMWCVTQWSEPLYITSFLD